MPRRRQPPALIAPIQAAPVPVDQKDRDHSPVANSGHGPGVADTRAALMQMWWRIRNQMRDIEAAVTDEQRFGASPTSLFQGECFWRAYLYCQMHYPVPGIWYVYGESSLGAAVGIGLHAWVELPGDVVFDGTLQRFYCRAAYYERLHARAYYRFTAEAAGHIFIELERRLGNVVWYWDTYLGLPCSRQDDPPLQIDLAEAERLIASSSRLPAFEKPCRRRKGPSSSPV
jgi:hypothetical protein